MKTNRQHGFTIIEIIIALGIMMLLLVIGVVSARTIMKNVRIKKAQNDLVLISGAIDLMRLDTGEWPGHQPPKIVCTKRPGGCPGDNEICLDSTGPNCDFPITSGFAGLLLDHSSNPYEGWNGPYMGQIPLDPWGHQYFIDTDYRKFGTSVDIAVIGSYGPNGEGNNSYDSDDIIFVIAY